LIHLALGFFKTSQEADTGRHAKVNVKKAAVPVAAHTPITIYIGTRVCVTEKMRRYCVKIEILMKVKPQQ
jgi:hypothetical protein